MMNDYIHIYLTLIYVVTSTFSYFHITNNNTNNFFAAMIAFKMVLSEKKYTAFQNQIEESFNELSSKLIIIPINKIRSMMGFPNNWKRLKTL